MTAREKLQFQLRRRVQLLAAGLTLFVASGFLSLLTPYALVLAPVGLLLAIGTIATLQFALRCPFCRLPLGQLIFTAGCFWNVGSRFNFCPKCGGSLDQQIA